MNIDIPIKRFKYSDTMTMLLDNFARIHQYDDRKDFRRFWDEFVIENHNAFECEVGLLESRGFTGDPYIAMYKSTRFYYRKLYINDSVTSNIKKIKTHRYSKFNNTLLTLIDTVIEKHISENITRLTDHEFICDITPSSSYKTFYDDYENDITLHIGDYVRQMQSVGGEIVSSIISNKLKKTFKNRFYKIQEKLKYKL